MFWVVLIVLFLLVSVFVSMQSGESISRNEIYDDTLREYEDLSDVYDDDDIEELLQDIEDLDEDDIEDILQEIEDTYDESK